MLGVKLGTFLLTSQLCLAAHSLPRPSPPQRASQGRERSAWRPPVPAVTDGAVLDRPLGALPPAPPPLLQAATPAAQQHA